MAVAADGVNVKEVSHAEFSEAELDPACRQLREGRKRSTSVLNLFMTQSKYLVVHGPGEVRSLAYRRVTHHVKIREASQAERLAQALAPGFFDINQNLD